MITTRRRLSVTRPFMPTSDPRLVPYPSNAPYAFT
jgi:hypothetical protein